MTDCDPALPTLRDLAETTIHAYWKVPANIPALCDNPQCRLCGAARAAWAKLFAALSAQEDREQALQQENLELKLIVKRALWLQFQRSALTASTNDAAWALTDLGTALDELPLTLHREISGMKYSDAPRRREAQGEGVGDECRP